METPPRRGRWPWLLLVMSVALQFASSQITSSSSSSGSSSGEVELPANDCALLTRFCDWNATTASCVFRESVAFQCARAAPHWDCRWELTGDLVLADNVSVSVTGNDCAIHTSTNMLVLGAQSRLHAASVSVDAAFVRLEKGAELSAQYDGLTYRESPALFPGDAVRGASHGGSGGRVLYLNETTDQIFGTYFDVRPSSEMATLASRAWDLEPLWAKTDATTTNRTMLLLGSGSTGALAGGRLRVVASRDLVLLAGAAITANGEHAADESASGGAGGSVFLSATALSLSETSRIQARGGNAFCPFGPRLHSVRDCVPGGGGGRVHIAYVSSQLDDHAVDVGGGTLDRETLALDRVQKLVHPVEQRALAGAAGTYLRVFRVAKTTPRQSESDDQSSTSSDGDPTVRLYQDSSTVTSEAMLLITNRRGPDDATTSETVGVGAVTPLEINDTHRRIDSLVLMDGAAVATRGLALAAGDISLTNGSVLLDASVLHSTEGSNALEITARHMTASGFSQMVLPAQDATFYTTTLVLDATTAVRFAQQRVTLAAAATLRVDAHVVGSSSASSLALIGGKDVAVGGAGLSAGALFFHADGSISVTAERLDAVRAASIDALFQPCDPKREKKSDRHASQQQIARAFLAFAEASNFTMLLQASHSIAVGISPDGSSMRRTTTVQLDATSAPLSTSTSAPVPPLPSSSSSPLPIVSLTASAILVCAENLINLGDGAVVASNGRGEQANQGPGTGDCVGSVGGGGGYGGRGADSSVVNAVGDFASGGLAYGTRSGIGMLGSGGGCVDGGAGGGVVMVGAQGIVLDGQVHCNGDGGLASGGGGSGGFLGLTIADFLRGHGRISAVGGGAQCKELGGNKALQDALQQPQLPGETNTTNSLTRRLTANEAETQAAADVSTPRPEPIERVCGGGGGGGRLQLHGCERNDIDACTRGFDGNYTVAGGATFVPRQANDTHRDKLPRAASGSFVGFPCLPGSGGLFCRVCVPGTFKAESNSEECLVCTNAPSNAHYVGYGEISSACDWACDPGYSGDNCVSPIQQLLDACGGVLGFGLILLGIVGFLILLGYACRTRKEPSYSRTGHGRHHRPGTHHAMDGVVTGSKSERQHLLRAAIVSTQRSKFAWLLRWLYWPRVGYPKLVERDLPEHMARIYFTGLNDRDAPLKLRLTVPPQLRSVLYEDEFRLLAERINAALVWHHGVVGSFGEVVYRLVCVLCFPAASAVLAYRRHIRVNALKRIVARYNHACMKGPRARGLLNALKLGYSGDYSLVYLELLHKESSQSACVPTTAIGKPSLPIVLLFAGRGTYESPFYLDPSDLLVRSIPQCPELTAFIDEPWIAFVAELNELLRVVSNKDVSLVETLLPVAQFLEHEMAAAAAGGVGGGGGGGGGGRGGGGGGIGGASSSLGGKLGGLRIYLGRFYVGDEVDCGEEFKLGILVTTAANESSENLASLNQQWMGDTNSLQPTSITNNTSRYDSSSRYGPPRSMESMGYPTEDAVLSYDHLSNHWSYTPNNSNNQRNGGVRRGSSTASNNPTTATASGPPSHKSTVSSIREEALRIRSNTSGSVDNLLVSGHRLSDFDAPELLHGNGPASRTGHGRGGGASLNQRNQLRRRTRRQRFYEGWLGPVDGSLPVPGVLISADELEDRLADRTWQQKLEYYLRRVFMPANVPASKWLGAYWMVNTALLSLLMVDLAITFAMVVNLRCVTNGEVDRECSATILMPVLLLPPLTLFLAPIMGIVSLAIASNSFSRRYAIWNALSMGNVAVAILACLTQSSRLVAPWFTAPLPLLPVIAMVIKGGEAYVVERYIALQETTRRRRGWRGLMKRRLSDASMPVESPYSSPVSSGYTPSYLTTTSMTYR